MNEIGDLDAAYMGELVEQAYQSRGARFGNARLVRTMFERATVNLADRLAEDADITRDELTTFHPAFLIAAPRAARAPNRDAAALVPGAPLFASGNQRHWRH